MKSLSILLLFLLYDCRVPGLHLSDTGPYNIGMRKFETCEDEGTRQIKFPTKIYAVGNGVHELNGPFYLEVPFDDITQITVTAYNRGNGGWKFFYKYPITGCKPFKAFSPTIYGSLQRNMGLSSETCNVPAGNYTIKEWRVEELRIEGLPVLPYGEYKLVIVFSYKDKRVGCVIAFADAVRKW